jgi:glycerate kinase
MSTKILVAPTAYKGTLSPAEVAEAIAAGVRDAAGNADIVLAPVADGGDGTIESLHMARGGTVHKLAVRGPLSEPAQAAWLEINDLAVIELANASGLALVPPDRLRPLSAHTEGTGEVLAHCVASGVPNIVVAVGGSASTDGGTGALRSLGARFLDADGQDLGAGGGGLTRLHSCDLSGLNRWLNATCIRVATDVTNPLLGPAGAAGIFAPQKGADAEQVELLEAALGRLADVLESATGRRSRDLPGAGAAGGTAFGLACALGAEIIPGFRWIADLTQLEMKVKEADLIITGEGRLDRQSLSGKVIGELAAICRCHNKPLYVLPALAEDNVDWQNFGIAAVTPLATGSERISGKDISTAATALIKKVLG